MSEHRVLARCIDFDFGIEDHGCPFILGHFEYEDGGCQGFGIIPDLAFLFRFISAIGSDTLQGVNGKSCWVVFDSKESYSVGSDSSHIIRIDPLHKKNGKPFDIVSWRKWLQKQPRYSAHELLTGEKP